MLKLQLKEWLFVNYQKRNNFGDCMKHEPMNFDIAAEYFL